MTDVDDGPTGTAWGAMRVMLAPGGLLVAREGPAILVADPRTPGQEALVDRLLELCAEAARTGAGSVRGLVRAAASSLTAAAPDDVPALAMVAVDADGLLVTLTTGMRMSVAGPGGVETVDADRSVLPVNRVVRETGHVAIAPDPTDLAVDRRSNLAGGVVRAGGLLLVPGDEVEPPEQSPETYVDLAVPAAVEPVTFETFPLRDELPEEPTAEESPVAEVREGPEVLVRGIVCSRGHLNPPDARFCERCGISTVHQTHNVVTGPRPPLGVLVIDDGSVHTLTRDHVVGRDPTSADDVRDGRATALTLEDPELSLSRVHARLVLDGWEVRVEDAGSANGTFVAGAGSDEWRRLEPDSPTTITPGTRVRMGSRRMTFESHHKV